MRIGTMFMGRVEATERESIQTKFLIVGVPLVPLTSVIVTDEQFGGVRGIEIPLHGASVLAGYLRFYLFVAALMAGFFAYLEHSYQPAYGLIATTVVSAIAWVASMFALGQLSYEERERRERLRRATGLGVPPDFLPTDLRAEILGKLTTRWAVLGEGIAWKARLEGGQAGTDELPTLHALAEYEGEAAHARMAARQMKA